MASQQSSAITASLGCMMPFKTIFNLLKLLIFLIVYQVIERSLFARSTFRSVYCRVDPEHFWISYNTGNATFEVSRTAFTSLLRMPSTWASTVMARAENPYFSASLTCVSVIAQSFDMYICIIRIPSPFASTTSEQERVDKVLKEKTISFFFATLAGTTSPKGWERVFMAQGAKPKGRESFLPKRLVVRSVVDELASTRGTIMSR